MVARSVFVSKRLQASVVMFICLGIAYQANAQQPAKTYDSYFSISENEQIGLASPLQLLTEAAQEAVVLLLSWQHHEQALPIADDPYKRLQHFGTWIVDKAEHHCFNTRAKVLIRDSKSAPEFAANGCRVTAGEWQDPYSGEVFNDAKDIQIDHVVPLKNAYDSGAWTWDYNKRCLYGNFLKNEFHLLAVSGHENMKKGDGTPAVYMPPVQEYTCQYLQSWLKIKLIWGLVLNPDEASAIQELSSQHHCGDEFMKYTKRELANQRKNILDNISLCENTAGQ